MIFFLFLGLDNTLLISLSTFYVSLSVFILTLGNEQACYNNKSQIKKKIPFKLNLKKKFSLDFAKTDIGIWPYMRNISCDIFENPLKSYIFIQIQNKKHFKPNLKKKVFIGFC